MAIKTIVRCTCDACGKEIKERYLITFCRGNWDDPQDRTKELSRDLCYECYTQLVDLIDAKKVEAVQSTKIRRKAGRSLTPEEMKRFTKEYEDGISDKTLMVRHHLTFGQVRGLCRKLKASGRERGINKQLGDPNLDGSADPTRTVVDGNGLVLHIG